LKDFCGTEAQLILHKNLKKIKRRYGGNSIILSRTFIGIIQTLSS